MKRYLQILALSWIACVAAWAVLSWLEVGKGGHMLPHTTKSAVGALTDNCWQKEFLINLNGLWTRILGRRTNKYMVRLDGDMIVEKFLPRDTEWMVTRVKGFANLVKEAGTNLLFLHHPVKKDVGNMMLAGLGIDDFSIANDNSFREAILRAEIPYFDQCPVVAATPADVYENFFRSDHHWNYCGAFRAARATAEALAEACGGDPAVARGLLDSSKWEVKELQPRFCGSYLRRTGLWFGTTDELKYFVPRFATVMAISRPESSGIKDKIGSFQEVIVDSEKFVPPKSSLEDHRYEVYFGWEYPVQEVKCQTAPIKKRIVYITESYGLPVVGFLSTVFSEIDIIDLRHYRKPVIEYIRNARPDLVAVNYSPSFLFEGLWDFDLKAGE